jgi:hypothetical protein
MDWNLRDPPDINRHDVGAAVILFELISASVTLALSAIDLVLFFRKHQFFPYVNRSGNTSDFRSYGSGSFS